MLVETFSSYLSSELGAWGEWGEGGKGAALGGKGGGDLHA